MKIKNRKDIAKNVILSGGILVLFSICVLQMNIGNQKISDVVSNMSDNAKIEWGIKRENNH